MGQRFGISRAERQGFRENEDQEERRKEGVVSRGVEAGGGRRMSNSSFRSFQEEEEDGLGELKSLKPKKHPPAGPLGDETKMPPPSFGKKPGGAHLQRSLLKDAGMGRGGGSGGGGGEVEGKKISFDSSVKNDHIESGPSGPITKKICSLAELKAAQGQRLHLEVEKRFITVLYDPFKKVPRAIDSICYHMGGPLTVGDIEELDGVSCVTCPWHHLPISLHDGKKLSRPVTFHPETKKPIPSDSYQLSKKKFQRVHQAEVKGGEVFVTIDTSEKIESDKYAFREDAARNLRLGGGARVGGDGGRQGMPRGGRGQPGNFRSGYVLNPENKGQL